MFSGFCTCARDLLQSRGYSYNELFVTNTPQDNKQSDMSSKAVNEVVLLDSDSDSDSDTDQHPSKRPKLATSQEAHPIAPFRKPFQESDSESQDAEDRQDLSKTAQSPEVPDENFDELESSDSNDSIRSLDLGEINPNEINKDEGTDSSEANTNALVKRTIYETRKFLKERGVMAFLEEFLPQTALSEEIYKLIVKLGFYPRNLPPFKEGENLLQLIKLLHLAIKRVRQLRARLDNFYTLEHALDKIRSANKILVITGAGISTSLGIPDFRSSKGLYSRLSYLGLNDPQEVFDLDIFRTDPSIFYSIAHLILPPDNVYAPLHKFIKLLQDKGKLLRNYTQNIDNLEANAGVHYDKLIQCHGSFAFASCVTCGYKVRGDVIYPSIRNKELAFCPHCAKARKRLMNNDETYVEESYGVMKPDITFFGESLPRAFHDNINRDLRECDLIISIGTSLKVAPVADIVDKVPQHVPQILINKDAIHHCNFDVSFLGYCDDAAAYLCNQLGEGWALDHPQYDTLLGTDKKNLTLESTKERGVHIIHNKIREEELSRIPPDDEVQPDLVVLEPTI